MNRAANSYTTCPLQPRVDPPPRLVEDPIAAARVPPYACNREQCQLWMRAFNAEGKLLGEYCAITGIVAGLGQLSSILFTLVNRNAGVAAPPSSPPSA